MPSQVSFKTHGPRDKLVRISERTVDCIPSLKKVEAMHRFFRNKTQSPFFLFGFVTGVFVRCHW